MSKPSDLVQGTLDLLLLKILALEPMHGWAIGQRLTQVSGEQLQVSDGSLYPALHIWNSKAGSPPRGRKPSSAAGRSSTPSRARAAATSNTKRKTGNGCRPPSAGSSD